MLQRKPYETTRLEEERAKDKGRVFTVRLNDDEYKKLQDIKKMMRQPKDSTAIKQLADIGMSVLHEHLFGTIFDVIIGNQYRNKKTGIPEFVDK